MRTCFIHVGIPKTGTTSIQVTLHNHREELRRHGFLYPHAGISAGFTGHHDIALELFDGPASLTDCKSINALIEEIHNSNDNIIISSEGFGVALHSPHKFKSFVAGLQRYTPHIVFIIYLRNQTTYARSHYLQWLRQEYRETFDAFLSSVLHEQSVRVNKTVVDFRYNDLIDLIPSGDGVELIVRTYERAGATSVVADFLSIFNLTLGDLNLQVEPRENTGLTLAESFRLFYQNRRNEPIGAGEKWAISAIGKVLDGERVDITGTTRQRIVAAFDRSNRLLNARFGECRLVTLATENRETWSDERLHIEHLFSDATVRLVEGIAEGYREIDDARSAALVERDSLAAAHDRAIAERDARGQECVAAIAERDACERERDLAIAERNTCERERDRAIAERDVMLASRSWRVTAPVRGLRAWFARRFA